jgi:predicted lipase
VRWVASFGNPNSAGFGYVAVLGEKTISVVWRGTDNIGGWIKDFTFLQVAYPGVAGAFVHKGFYDVYLSNQPQVKGILQQALQSCPKCTEIVVSGHSLGGALSTLSALAIKGQTSLPIQVYNFW